MDNQLPTAPALPENPSAALPSPAPSSFKRVFIGSKGLRSGWRAFLFYVGLGIFIFCLISLVRAIRARLGFPHQAITVLTPGRAFLNESIFFSGVLGTAAIFARLEKRGFADYGLPLQAFGPRFLEGLLWGVTMMSATLLVLRATGNFSFGSIALKPPEIVWFAIVWAVFFIIVGITESFAFSGYPLFALARGLGFWPAAAILALFFGGIHFAVNAGENWPGSVSLVIVGLLLPFTLRRTGSLWFAIGIHAAWDWAQSFLYGVPDSGVTFYGHLFNPSFHGSKWMTGGTAGPEASLVTLLGYVFAFAVINFRFPEMRSSTRIAESA